MEVIQYLKEFNIVSVLVRLVLSVLLSGLIGIERGKHGRAAGLRTHIIVCLGATLTSLIGLYANYELHMDCDILRIPAQVISGIGFLGAGTILIKNKSLVTGLTTAACVWATACIGIAVGYGFYLISIVTAIIIFLVVGKLGDADRHLCRDIKEINIYAEFVDAKFLNETLTALKEEGINILSINVMQAKTRLDNGIGAELTISVRTNHDIQNIVSEINTLDNICFAIATP